MLGLHFPLIGIACPNDAVLLGETRLDLRMRDARCRCSRHHGAVLQVGLFEGPQPSGSSSRSLLSGSVPRVLVPVSKGLLRRGILQFKLRGRQEPIVPITHGGNSFEHLDVLQNIRPSAEVSEPTLALFGAPAGLPLAKAAQAGSDGLPKAEPIFVCTTS